jgi:hypothetical protein
MAAIEHVEKGMGCNPENMNVVHILPDLPAMNNLSTV